MRVIVVGAGINGVTTAIELNNRGHDIVLVDPGPLPHPLAASTDISKAVRGAYGADERYTELAERSTLVWRKWNDEFGIELYHEVGFLFLRQHAMRAGDFEHDTLKVFDRRRRKFDRIDSAQIRKRFPAWNAERYCDGIFDIEAGYVESGQTIARLIARAEALGVKLRQNIRFTSLDENDADVKGIVIDGHERIAGDAVVMATGAWTPYLLPFTRAFLRSTSHPVFHLKPSRPELFQAEFFPVFGADISTTGYYGFPINRNGVVKIGNHGAGHEMSPASENRNVSAEDINQLREFLSESLPALADAPMVSARLCMYCDTLDGDFWIARDPERRGLVIAAGDNGHGFKFAPMLGEITADAVEGRENPRLEKFRWRPEVRAGASKEAARFQPDDAK